MKESQDWRQKAREEERKEDEGEEEEQGLKYLHRRVSKLADKSSVVFPVWAMVCMTTGTRHAKCHREGRDDV